MRGMFPMAVALAAVAAFAQDVVQLAPDQVKVVFENDHVRVLHFNEPGHSKLPMHSHPAYVTVGFTTDHSKYMFPDGKTSDERTKADDVTYSKGLREVAALPDPVGRVLDERVRPNGLKLRKVSTPIGVVV